MVDTFDEGKEAARLERERRAGRGPAPTPKTTVDPSIAAKERVESARAAAEAQSARERAVRENEARERKRIADAQLLRIEAQEKSERARAEREAAAARMQADTARATAQANADIDRAKTEQAKRTQARFEELAQLEAKYAVREYQATIVEHWKDKNVTESGRLTLPVFRREQERDQARYDDLADRLRSGGDISASEQQFISSAEAEISRDPAAQLSIGQRLHLPQILVGGADGRDPVIGLVKLSRLERGYLENAINLQIVAVAVGTSPGAGASTRTAPLKPRTDPSPFKIPEPSPKGPFRTPPKNPPGEREVPLREPPKPAPKPAPKKPAPRPSTKPDPKNPPRRPVKRPNPNAPKPGKQTPPKREPITPRQPAKRPATTPKPQPKISPPPPSPKPDKSPSSTPGEKPVDPRRGASPEPKPKRDPVREPEPARKPGETGQRGASREKSSTPGENPTDPREDPNPNTRPDPREDPNPNTRPDPREDPNPNTRPDPNEDPPPIKQSPPPTTPPVTPPKPGGGGGRAVPPRPVAPPVQFGKRSKNAEGDGEQPIAFQWRQGFAAKEVDLNRGRIETVPESEADVPKKGGARETLRAVKFSKRKPRRRKFDIGAVVAKVSGVGSIEFEQDTGQAGVIREKSRLGP